MEDCSILLLPEISEMILQHLDAEERQEAVLVSQAFYSTIRHLERKQTLVLYDTKVNLKIKYLDIANFSIAGHG